ncbi:MAG: hypothetical protein ACFFFG_04995 [Candidatus Thorarchaeota archaeon]
MKNWETAEDTSEIVNETGATHFQIALAWVPEKDGIRFPVFPVCKLEHFEEGLGALRANYNL